MPFPEKRTKGERTPGGWGTPFSRQRVEDGYKPVLSLFISVHQRRVIICNHLRQGQLPSDGPRQKEGAESRLVGPPRRSREVRLKFVLGVRLYLSEKAQTGAPSVGTNSTGQKPGVWTL